MSRLLRQIRWHRYTRLPTRFVRRLHEHAQSLGSSRSACASRRERTRLALFSTWATCAGADDSGESAQSQGFVNAWWMQKLAYRLKNRKASLRGLGGEGRIAYAERRPRSTAKVRQRCTAYIAQGDSGRGVVWSRALQLATPCQRHFSANTKNAADIACYCCYSSHRRVCRLVGEWRGCYLFRVSAPFFFLSVPLRGKTPLQQTGLFTRHREAEEREGKKQPGRRALRVKKTRKR